MKRRFEEPFYEAVVFNRQGIIITSNCDCLIPEMPEVTDTIDCPNDHPECSCGSDVTVNCTITT